MKIRTKALVGGTLAAVVLVTLAAVPASADTTSGLTPNGAGEWDYKGSDVFTSQSKNFASGGGDFKVCLSPGSKTGDYRLMEEDPFAPDDIVNSHNIVDPLGFRYPYDTDSNGCYVYRGISSYVDGTNHQAEFYLIKWTGGNSTVKAYD